MVEPAQISELSNSKEEKGILSALEEDLGLSLGESREIPEEDKSDLRESCTKIANRIIEVYDQYLTAERKEWLLDLASTATFLTPDDFQRFFLKSELLHETNDLRKKILFLKLKTDTLEPQDGDEITDAVNWDPLVMEGGSPESKFILAIFRPSSLEHTTKQELLESTMAEELLHALDQIKARLARYDTDQVENFCQAAAKTYALEVFPDWYKEGWENANKRHIQGYRQLEIEFGQERLKNAFFQDGQVDLTKIAQRSGEIWGNSSTSH